MSSIVVRNVCRVSHDDVETLRVFGVATIHEAMGRRGLMASRLRPIFPGATIAGNAVTASMAPGDNTMLHVAVEMCQEGDVVVASPTSPSEDGYFGELLATSLRQRGVRGLIIDAGCRDIAPLKEMKFPVWSKAIFAQGTVKETLGSVNIPLLCAGQMVHAGDVVVADDDGIVVVPHAEIAATLIACANRTTREEINRARFQKGELGLDVYGMREKLAEKGLVYVDQLPAGWENGR